MKTSVWFLAHFISIFLLPTLSFPIKQQNISDLLLPLHSTTALICDPVFKTTNSTAHWYKNGIHIATVGSDYNALYMNRNDSMEKEDIPQVGFLIIRNIEKEDMGLFHCETIGEDSKSGDMFNLKVAYVDPLPRVNMIKFEPSKPIVGRHLYAHCPIPQAVPRPSIEWNLNGEPVSATSSESYVFPNGTLLIRYITNLHIGKLECIVSNFAAKTSTYKELLPDIDMPYSNNELSFKCGSLLRMKVLWFLIGCLVTSFCVLLYLLCVLMVLRPNHRATFRPAQWLQTHPLLGPGFRKVITPIPDVSLPRQEEI